MQSYTLRRTPPPPLVAHLHELYDLKHAPKVADVNRTNARSLRKAMEQIDAKNDLGVTCLYDSGVRVGPAIVDYCWMLDLGLMFIMSPEHTAFTSVYVPRPLKQTVA
jgi:hypothetical protein